MIPRAGLVLALLLALGTTACGGGADASARTTTPKRDTPAKHEPVAALDPVLVCADTRGSVPADQVARIEIRGARLPSDLCTRVKHGIGKPFDDQRIDDDLRLIYADGRVEDVTVFREEGTRVVLVYHVRMRPPVVSFEIRGSDDPGTLPGGVLFERPEVADPALLRSMKADATHKMREAGYLLAEVDFDMAPRDNGVAIVLRVTSGPRALVRSVRFEGPSAERARELSSLMLTTVGKPLDRPALERDALVITAAGYDQGKLTTAVSEPEIVLQEDGAAVEIVLRVAEGPTFRLGKVSFEGDLLGPTKTYTNELWTLKPGAVFSRATAAADIERIRSFHEKRGSLVDVTPSVDLDMKRETVDVKVHIDQRR